APGERGAFLSGVRNDLVSASFRSRVKGGVSRTILSWYRDRTVLEADGAFRSDNRRANTPDPEERPLSAFALQWNHLVRDLSARQEVLLPIGGRHALETGFELHRLRAGVTFTIEGGRNPSPADGSSVRGGAGGPDVPESANAYTRGGSWLEDRFRWSDRLTVVPGLRLDWSGMNGRAIVSPRMSGTLGLGRSTRLRAAAGIYTQSPGYEKLIQADYLVDQ